jgi:hypothetical protein
MLFVLKKFNKNYYHLKKENLLMTLEFIGFKTLKKIHDKCTKYLLLKIHAHLREELEEFKYSLSFLKIKIRTKKICI